MARSSMRSLIVVSVTRSEIEKNVCRQSLGMATRTSFTSSKLCEDSVHMCFWLVSVSVIQCKQRNPRPKRRPTLNRRSSSSDISRPVTLASQSLTIFAIKSKN